MTPSTPCNHGETYWREVATSRGMQREKVCVKCGKVVEER